MTIYYEESNLGHSKFDSDNIVNKIRFIMSVRITL